MERPKCRRTAPVLAIHRYAARGRFALAGARCGSSCARGTACGGWVCPTVFCIMWREPAKAVSPLPRDRRRTPNSHRPRESQRAPTAACMWLIAAITCCAASILLPARFHWSPAPPKPSASPATVTSPAKSLLNNPHGILVALDGTIYIGDSDNNRVRRIQQVAVTRSTVRILWTTKVGQLQAERRQK